MPSRAATDLGSAILVKKLCFLAAAPRYGRRISERSFCFVVTRFDPRALDPVSFTGAGHNLGKIRSTTDDHVLLGIGNALGKGRRYSIPTRRELERAVLSILRGC
jgi:hypothetical protein